MLHVIRTMAAALVTAVSLASSIPAAAAAELELTKPAEKLLKAMPQSWVKTGQFNEIDQKMFASRTLSAPEVVKFKWGTDAEKANEGFWRLVQQGAAAGEAVLATGIAGPGKGGLFSIDFAKYLPPTAPAAPLVYHVQVVARLAAAVDGGSATSAGQSGKKVPAKEVSFWSAPVVITYLAGAAPVTKFDFPEVYRTATFVLDQITVVTDQIGGGQEEYHTAGFVQELFREPQLQKFILPGKQVRFGPNLRILNPPKSQSFEYEYRGFATLDRWSFTLGSQPHTWPRRYVAAISLMEEDAGSELGLWGKGVKQLAKDVANSKLLDLASDELEDYLVEHIFDGISYVADAVQTIANSAAATGVGAAIAVAIPIAVAIYEDSADDNYGTRLATLTLPSPHVDVIHKLPGTLKANGTYVTKPRFLEFKGPPPANSAVPTDGTVHIVFHWEFSDRTVE